MDIHSVELTMSHTGLGNLNEYALMVLFGNAHSLRLTKNIGITPNEIVAMDGTVLYPAYFWTHLKVPLSKLLHNYKLWNTVDIGVEVKRFGDTLLESSYALGDKNSLNSMPDFTETTRFPVMRGNNLLVAEELNASTAKRSVLNPNPDKISNLEKMTRTPEGIARSRKVRSEGVRKYLSACKFENRFPFSYRILDGRDCTQGHAMIFAKFADIFDLAEKDFLSNQVFPGISNALINRLSVLDREIYYYGNCYAGEEIEVFLAGSIELNEDDDMHADQDIDFIPAAYLHIGFEVYQQRTKTLLASSITKKVFAVPMQEQECIHDLRRVVLAW